MTDNGIYQSLMDVAAVEETSRLERFRRAWEAYYGTLAKPLMVKPGKPDDNVRLNFARVIVDKGVSFLFGKDLDFEVGEEETSAQDEYLDGFWRQNRRMTTLQKIALNGGVCGHTFVKLKVQAGYQYPRLIVLDPETISVKYAPDDIEQVLEYKIQYSGTDPKTGKAIGIRQLIRRDGERWTITDQVGDMRSLAWTTINTELWPYLWSPVIHCQNLPSPNEFWGISDLEDDTIDLVKSINFVMSNLARIIRYHAHPKTWGKGFTANDLKIGVDETVILPSPDAMLQNLEMTSDLASSIEMYKRLREALHEITRIPEVATGKLDSTGGLSGVALEILYQPLLEKTSTKRLLYGDMIVSICQHVLEMGGQDTSQDIELHWQEMLPKDPKAEREVALLDQQLGVSQDTILTRLGYDPDLEREKKAAQTDELGEKLLSAFDKGNETA